jgi:hypothetical protein
MKIFQRVKRSAVIYWSISLFIGIIAFTLSIIAPLLFYTLPYKNYSDHTNAPWNILVFATCIFSWISSFLSIFFHNIFHERDKQMGFVFSKSKRNIPLFLNILPLILLITFLILLVRTAMEQ